MSKLKKVIVGILTVAMFCSVLPAQKAEAASDYKKLTSLTYTDSYNSLECSHYKLYCDEITTPTGEKYKRNNLIFLDASLDAHISYNLNKKYTKLTGKIVTSTETGDGAMMTVAFYGDGKLLKKFTGISNTNQNKSFNIDVSNVKKLEIKSSNPGSFYCGYVYLVDSRLYGLSLLVSEKELQMSPGNIHYLQYSIKKGEEEINKTATWTSSNKNVAKVSSKGKVVAVNPGICKIICKVGNLKKEVKVIVKPKKVSGLKTLSKANTSVQLSWKKQTGVKGYAVYMYDSDLEEFTKVANRTGWNTVTVKKLKKGKIYQFKVRAYVQSGNKKYWGLYSNVYKVKTKK